MTTHIINDDFFNNQSIVHVLESKIPIFIHNAHSSCFTEDKYQTITTNFVCKILYIYKKMPYQYKKNNQKIINGFSKQNNVFTMHAHLIYLSQLIPQLPIIINHIYGINYSKLIKIKFTPIIIIKILSQTPPYSIYASNTKILKKKCIPIIISNTQNYTQFYTKSFTKLNYQTIKVEKNNIYNEKTPLHHQKKILPKSIQNQININNNLSIVLSKQKYYIQEISSKLQNTNKQILQIQTTFDKILEYKKWLEKSLALKEILRSQISKLPKTPNFQIINKKITQLQKKRFQCEYQIQKIPSLLLNSIQDDGTPLTLSQQYTLKQQLIIQHNLITALLDHYDAQILELTKLKFTYEIIKNKLQVTQKTIYRYLFWVADTYPITTSYPLDIYQDLYKLIIEGKFKQHIKSIIKIISLNPITIAIAILSTILYCGLYININQIYQNFLRHSSTYIGKVNQDNFLITFYNIWYSMLIALPIPIFWLTIGHILNYYCSYSITESINDNINSTAFILWISIISAYFSSSKGLFISHFGWSQKRVQQIFSRYYFLSISIIILLIIALAIFNNYKREFYATLGRLCFILLCIYSTYITNKLKNSKLPLYINKYNSSNNIINYSLWNIMIYTPIIACIACTFGYFFTAQELLIRLETSLFIWILLLIIYHLAKRWISIQRRRIAFERATQKRIQKLVIRQTQNKLKSTQNYTSTTIHKTKINKNYKKISDLDTINIQSLQLIRSIIILIAILLTTLLWSDLHSTFSFLDKITLWDVTSTIKGINNVQPITLNSFIIAALVIIITTKTVQNLPAFLELTLLQYLQLTTGTKYTITTCTKYILMLLGGIIGFSLIGIEWSKIQWLIAALGVGLGFGIQEIFANFVSGLMILLEKPIRIGDTITIHNFTGNVTQINIRATTITDWNHKEIIIPNKEFITKKFINWSLSDTITRVVIKIPGPIQINAQEMTLILLQIAKHSSLALNTPPPEVYLSDLQQGFPIFEIRMYVADTKLRMPLCHQIHLLIIEYYQKNKITFPYLPYYIHKNQLTEIETNPTTY